MRELLNKFFIWLRKPDPDTILIKLWRKKRDRDKAIEGIESKRQAEEYRQKVKEQAYLLWEADGRQEGKDEYYWRLAVDKVKGKNVPTIYKPYYLLEKRILEPADRWISRQAFFTIAAQLAILAAIIAFVGGETARRNNEVFAAWTTITTAQGQSGSGGRIRALEFLNSRPLRFPWIGWTKRDWYWDEEEWWEKWFGDEQDEKCVQKRLLGRRWTKEPLVGLSAPNEAFLAEIHLCGANLSDADLTGANLIDADLSGALLLKADLSGAFLDHANLSDAHLIGANLFKADLSDAELTGAHLFKANLRSVNLSGAFLRSTNLIDADLSGAHLVDTDLSDAFLRSANLSGAFLRRTNLSGANLRNADLREVINLTPKQVKSACYWEDAYFNPEFKEKLNQETDQEVDCSRWEEN